NVLLAEGRGVSVRVLDFGLAQIQQAETLTAQGDVPGTLAYIAPERLAGGLTTEAADVWAVGLMLWEALAGRHPFWRGSLLETARAMPFFPSGGPLGLAALAAGGTIVDARLGLAFALAVPILPLGNLALGAAVLYAVIALGLLATMWREPQRGLLFSLGALLAPI